MNYSLGREILTNLGIKSSSNKELMSQEVIDTLGDNLGLKPGQIKYERKLGSISTKDNFQPFSTKVSKKITNHDVTFYETVNRDSQLQQIEVVLENSKPYYGTYCSISNKIDKANKKQENYLKIVMFGKTKDGDTDLYMAHLNDSGNVQVDYYDSEAVYYAHKQNQHATIDIDNTMRELGIYPDESVEIPNSSSLKDMAKIVNGVMKDGPLYCDRLIKGASKAKGK